MNYIVILKIYSRTVLKTGRNNLLREFFLNKKFYDKVVNILNVTNMLKLVTFSQEREGKFDYIKKFKKLQCSICEIFNKIFHQVSKLLAIELKKRKIVLNKFLENSRWSFGKKL